MTDEQIINNVKCCVKQISNCSQCSYRFNEDDEFDCEEALGRDILVLINRQKAEIENQRQIIDEKNKEIFGLQKRIVFWREDLNYQPEKIKVEAIKEFAERLKRISIGLEIGDDKKFKITVVSTLAIDTVLKEMTGGRNEKCIDEHKAKVVCVYRKRQKDC